MAIKRTHIMLNLVQCGQTHWERETRLHGSTNLPLSDAGRASLSVVVARLAGTPLGTVYHAADEAATETAHLVAAETGAKTKAVEDLREPNLGLWEGMLRQELAERYPKRYKHWEENLLSLIPPEGEAIADARARVFRTVSRLLKKSRAREVAVVLHPIAFGFVRCWMADRPGEEIWRVLEEGVHVARYALAVPLLDELRETAASAEAASS